MNLLAATILVLTANAHQSFGGGEDFAPHWEPPTWVNSDDPNGIKLGGGAGSTTGRGPLRTNDYRGAEQDDNFMSKDDDRRVYAPAYDDHHSYQHHPVAHKYSDEHFHDDEGRSTRVIHGQDTSKHVNRRSKKKVFDTIKEPKHHFAVQTIDVPFPMHHHYYNHTKVHYHDGYDIYDDDVGDSEKYYHVNPDTHTNVNGWFADDHYRVGGGQFEADERFDNDGGAASDAGFSGWGNLNDADRPRSDAARWGNDNRDDGNDGRRWGDDAARNWGDDNRDDGNDGDDRADNARVYSNDAARFGDDGDFPLYNDGAADAPRADLPRNDGFFAPRDDGAADAPRNFFAGLGNDDTPADDGVLDVTYVIPADDGDDHTHTAPHTHAPHVHIVPHVHATEPPKQPTITIPISQLAGALGQFQSLVGGLFN